MVQLGVSVSDRLATGLDAAQRLEQKKIHWQRVGRTEVKELPENQCPVRLG